MNYEWMQGEVPDTRYGLSDTGWVDTEGMTSPASVEACSSRETTVAGGGWPRYTLSTQND